MKCLYCYKETNDSIYHSSCAKKVFGHLLTPEIDIEAMINNITVDSVITGVQEKLSFSLSNTTKSHRVTLIDNSNYYIVKPPSKEFDEITCYEHLTMTLANALGIKTPIHSLIQTKDQSYAYIINRMDRKNNSKIHMEDFCQLSNRLTENKYSGSYEQIAKLIDKYCSMPMLDKTELFYRILFCFITGNNDMHLKNFSLIESDNIYLSEAYDLVPTTLLINDKSDMALTLNGKNQNLRKNDFLKFGANIGLNIKICQRLINKIIDSENRLIELIDNAILSDAAKEKYKCLIRTKITLLK